MQHEKFQVYTLKINTIFDIAKKFPITCEQRYTYNNFDKCITNRYGN